MSPPAWHVRDRVLALGEPKLMGVLNVTPDSFSDGGAYLRPEDAVARGLELLEQGAALIDVGAESTRPGAHRVAAAEQIARAIPVIERLHAATGAVLSIDTTSAEVADAAMQAGCHVINDVAAGTEDPAILDVAARHGAGLILMHRLRPSDADRYSDRYDAPPEYDDVVDTVRGFLARRCAAALEAGVARESIVVDPGLGFGKSVGQNFELIGRTAEIASLGHPVLSAASRKSFLGAVSGVTRPAERVAASVAVSVAHWMAGVRLFRVHDVRAHRDALAAASAITHAAAV